MRSTLTLICALGLGGCATEGEVEAPALEAPTREEIARSPEENEPAPPPSVGHSGAPVAALHEHASRETDRARSAQMLEQACDRGLAPSCLAFAERLEAGDGVEADAERARGLLEEACESGSTLACDRLGH